MTQPYVTHIVVAGKRTHHTNWRDALAERKATEERESMAKMIEAQARARAGGRSSRGTLPKMLDELTKRRKR